MLESITTWFKDLFQGIWDAFVAFWVNIVLTLFDMIKDVFFFIIDNVLDLAISALGAIGSGLSAMNPAQYISAIPPDVQNIIGLIRVGEAVAIIVTAILIRFALQTIPFVRWGS